MTVEALIKKLQKMPKDAKVCYCTDYLDDIRTVSYVEDYVYNTTYKTVVLNNKKCFE